MGAEERIKKALRKHRTIPKIAAETAFMFDERRAV